MNSCGVLVHKTSRVNVSLLTSMVGVGMRFCVIMPVQVQGHIVLAHQVHDLQRQSHIYSHMYAADVKR